MQISASLSLLTLVAIAQAAKEFGLVTIRSGSQLQYASVLTKDNDPTLYVGSGGDARFTLNDDGSFAGSDGKKFGFTDAGVATEEGNGITASTSFGLDGESLTYDGKQIYRACPNANKDGYVISIKDCTDGLGVILHAVDIKDVESKEEESKEEEPKEEEPKKDEPKEEAPSDEPSNFGLITIHSGSNVHLATVKKVDSHPHVFSVGGDEGKDLTLSFNSDGSLHDQDGRGVYVDPNTGEIGNVDPWGQQSASTGFSVENDDLQFQGGDGFWACPSGDNKFSLSRKECTGGTGVALQVVN
ncbi:hypothetical protein CLIB1423_19S01750 [[Candida] railenensis]|uniref:Cell wall protein n=1 Tax=[Candida] railenensis TaxID=45579 RepID=A0A9P0QTU6_9ASCO|nr:hypothetical protein CLIB1423_19S01750 [[Candida] railenensis]